MLMAINHLKRITGGVGGEKLWEKEQVQFFLPGLLSNELPDSLASSIDEKL